MIYFSCNTLTPLIPRRDTAGEALIRSATTEKRIRDACGLPPEGRASEVGGASGPSAGQSGLQGRGSGSPPPAPAARPRTRGSQHPEPARPGPPPRRTSSRARSPSARRPGSPSSPRALALPPSLIFFDNFGGKDAQLWGEFVSSLLNSERGSSKVLMCVCLFFF